VTASRADGTVSEAMVNANMASPGFFPVMGIPVTAGRTFAPGDLTSTTPGVLLSASLAGALFGRENAVGREVRIVSNRPYPSYRVVGVAGDVYSNRLTDGVLRTLYFPLLNELPATSTETEQRIPYMPAGVHFVVRSALPLSELGPAIRRAVASVDPRVPVWGVRSLDAIVAGATARTRLTLTLVGVAAAATVVLGAIGLYSVIAYAAAGRMREFAVRQALGATPRDVVRAVLADGGRVALGGIAAGLGASLPGARLIRGAVYGVSTTDPVVYAAAGLLVLATMTAATWLPARRAGRSDPATALRAD
jgi:hypothetical protein